MASESVYFRGATLGVGERNFTIGGTAQANVLYKKRRSGNSIVPSYVPTHIMPTSPPYLSVGVSVIVLGITGHAATMKAVATAHALYCGKIGVLKVGTQTIATEAYCAGVSLGADHPKGYTIAYSFIAIPGTGMIYYSDLQNGGFEAVGDAGAMSLWTAVPGNGTIATHERTGADRFGTGQFAIKWTYGATQSNATHFYQTLGVPTADETTDDLYTRFSIDAYFESQTTTARTTTVSLDFNSRPTGDAFDIADRLYSNVFTLYSNKPQRLSISSQTGLLTAYTTYKLSVCVTGDAGGTEGDVIYFDNAEVEEIHNLELR